VGHFAGQIRWTGDFNANDDSRRLEPFGNDGKLNRIDIHDGRYVRKRNIREKRALV